MLRLLACLFIATVSGCASTIDPIPPIFPAQAIQVHLEARFINALGQTIERWHVKTSKNQCDWAKVRAAEFNAVNETSIVASCHYHMYKEA